MDTKSIIPLNNSNSNNQLPIQQNLEQNKDTLFHDRAAIVCRDILQQIGFDADKMRMIAGVTSAISMLPPIGALGKAQDMIKEIEPLMLMVQNNNDPAAYLKAIPQEKIEYFINQVIARLEWVKYGNSEESAITEKK